MSYRFRHWLFNLFVGLFIVLTLYISLQASGYRLSFSWPIRINRLLQKTGLLVTATTPKGALVVLNGQPQSNFSGLFARGQENAVRTPAKINNLLPGVYELRLELTGFWPFTQNFTLHEGESIYFDTVALLPQNQPLAVATTSSLGLQAEPNGSYLFLDGEKRILDITKNEFFPLDASSAAPFRFADNNRVLAGAKIFDAGSRQLLSDLGSAIGQRPSATRLYGSDYYYLSGGGLYHYSLKDQSGDLLYDAAAARTEILDYLRLNDRLALITKDRNGQKTFIRIYDSRDFSLKNERELPSGGNYQFLDQGGPDMQLYEPKSKTLYLIDPSLNAPILAALDNVKYYAWAGSGRLIYANDLEIYDYDIRSGNRRLMTRLSAEITGLAWHPRNYLLYSTADSIKLLNYEGSAASLQLAAAENIGALYLTPTGSALYYLAGKDGQKELYKLPLE
jgi:hypothetical protein